METRNVLKKSKKCRNPLLKDLRLRILRVLKKFLISKVKKKQKIKGFIFPTHRTGEETFALHVYLNVDFVLNFTQIVKNKVKCFNLHLIQSTGNIHQLRDRTE
jgi:hypothetical protein